MLVVLHLVVHTGSHGYLHMSSTRWKHLVHLRIMMLHLSDACFHVINPGVTDQPWSEPRVHISQNIQQFYTDQKEVYSRPKLMQVKKYMEE